MVIKWIRLLPGLLVGVLLNFAAQAQDSAMRDTADATQIVRQFNDSISRRQLDKALALVSLGSVNFNLRAAHRFTGNASATLTADLATHWRSITPILYGTSRRFERRVRHISAHADGDLVLVWAAIETFTEPKDGSKAFTVRFFESYQLRREGNTWRIISVASSRSTR